MYAIVRTKTFERSYKKLKRSGVKKQLLDDIRITIDTIASGKLLSQKCRDHQLEGYLHEYRECHVRPNVLLVYTIDHKDLMLILVDIGSHPSLFG